MRKAHANNSVLVTAAASQKAAAEEHASVIVIGRRFRAYFRGHCGFWRPELVRHNDIVRRNRRGNRRAAAVDEQAHEHPACGGNRSSRSTFPQTCPVRHGFEVAAALPVDGELAKLAECVMDLVLVRRTESCLHSPRTPSSTFVGCTELFSAHRVSSSVAAAPDRKAEDWVCEHGRAGCNS